MGFLKYYQVVLLLQLTYSNFVFHYQCHLSYLSSLCVECLHGFSNDYAIDLHLQILHFEKVTQPFHKLAILNLEWLRMHITRTFYPSLSYSCALLNVPDAYQVLSLALVIL